MSNNEEEKQIETLTQVGRNIMLNIQKEVQSISIDDISPLEAEYTLVANIAANMTNMYLSVANPTAVSYIKKVFDIAFEDSKFQIIIKDRSQ